MSINSLLKAVIFVTAMFGQSVSPAQDKMDLAEISFNEEIGQLIKAVPHIQEGKLQGRSDMISYGFDNDGRFTFAGVVPGQLELLSWKGKLVGYAFKIKSFAEQQKVVSFFKQKYNKASFQSSKFMDIYRHEGDEVHVELRTVIEQKFKEGANGYLDIKRTGFAKEFERMVQH